MLRTSRLALRSTCLLFHLLPEVSEKLSDCVLDVMKPALLCLVLSIFVSLPWLYCVHCANMYSGESVTGWTAGSKQRLRKKKTCSGRREATSTNHTSLGEQTTHAISKWRKKLTMSLIKRSAICLWMTLVVPIIVMRSRASSASLRISNLGSTLFIINFSFVLPAN